MRTHSLELLAWLIERVERPLTVIASWTTDGALPSPARALLDRLAASTVVIDVPLMDGTELEQLLSELAPAAELDELGAGLS